jgi:hypothetical protein
MKRNIARFYAKVFLALFFVMFINYTKRSPRPDCSILLCSLRRITRDIAKSRWNFLKTNVLSTPKIESSPFHLKISIKGRMNNSTEIRPNFKDGILRTFVSSKETTQIMKRIHTIITDFAAILG